MLNEQGARLVFFGVQQIAFRLAKLRIPQTGKTLLSWRQRGIAFKSGNFYGADILKTI